MLGNRHRVNVGPVAAALFRRKRGKPRNHDAAKYIEAMTNLHHRLWHGHVGSGILRTPIAGDTLKLPYAQGNMAFETQLARDVLFLSEQMPGTASVRRTMYHCATGAAVNYGSSIFITITPNEHHSALVLRLMRNRLNDTMLQGTEAVVQALRDCSSRDHPELEEGIGGTQTTNQKIGKRILVLLPQERRLPVQLRTPFIYFPLRKSAFVRQRCF